MPGMPHIQNQYDEVISVVMYIIFVVMYIKNVVMYITSKLYAEIIYDFKVYHFVYPL